MTDLSNVRCVLFLHCPEEVLEQRLLSRGKNSGRTDDNAEAAKKRFRTYVETTLPVSSRRFWVPVGLREPQTLVSSFVTGFSFRDFSRGTAPPQDSTVFPTGDTPLFRLYVQF